MRILWLKCELLHPIDKGGKIRTYQMLRELKRDHEITYLTLDDGAAAPDARQRASEYCDELICVPHRTNPKFSPGFYLDLARNIASPLPYFMQKYGSEEMRQRIGELATAERFDVLVCDFLMPSINLPDSIAIPSVLFQHNVEAMIWKRHAEVQRNPAKKAYLYDQWRKTRAFERAACGRFDQVVAVSKADSETMARQYGLERVADVPTGIDTEFFRPGPRESRRPHGLVFTGSMDWLPNEDAMAWFTESILPLVREAMPDVELTVVGRNPYPSLVELGKRTPSVEVTGRVDDVRPYMERASAYIVPMRVGGGTRLKIYEAMAMGLPVVSTSVGAEGLPVENGREILLADTPEEFADAVLRVLTNPDLALELGDRAGSFVRENCGWRVATNRFAELCKRAIDSRGITRAA